MANVNVQAQFMLNTGELISLSATLAEGSEAELTTSTTYSTSATSLGQFANGKVLTQIVQPPSALNGIAYAYIERRGAIICALLLAFKEFKTSHALCLSLFNSKQATHYKSKQTQQQTENSHTT